MNSSDVQRKLSIIICSDVVGYRRLMGDPPEGSLRNTIEFREVLSTGIHEIRGRKVSVPGISLLAESSLVLDAVNVAVRNQRNWPGTPGSWIGSAE